MRTLCWVIENLSHTKTCTMYIDLHSFIIISIKTKFMRKNIGAV